MLARSKSIYTEADLFDNPDQKYKTWKKGQISNPLWLKREVSHDFVTVKHLKDVESIGKFLSGEDERLMCEPYNTFSTGRDNAGNPMIVLYDQDQTGDQKKVCVIVIFAHTLAMSIVDVVEQYCEEE